MANLVGDDESGDALIDENEPVQPLQQPDAEDYSDPNWEPEPVDAGPGKHDFLFLSDYLGYDSSFTFLFFQSQDFRANKPSDIISTLVSIYDSKDLFVKELQVLLAQRLLATKDDDLEKVELEVPLSDYDLLHGRLMFSCLSTEAKH